MWTPACKVVDLWGTKTKKDIFDEALEELKYATTDLKDLEIIHSYDVSIIDKALKLGKLYKELSLALEQRFERTNDGQRIRDLQKQIKELENE